MIEAPIPFRDPRSRPAWKRLPDALRIGLNRRLDEGVPPIPESGRAAFVMGSGGSGTTLVASRLGNHPSVLLLPHETNLFEPRRPLHRARRAFAAAFAEARAEGRQIVLEKTPKHVRVTGRLRHLLPEARLLVVIRNPLDTCLSLSKFDGTLEKAIESWTLDNAAALRLAGNPRALLVHYEDVTADPEPAFRAMTDFLGLPWDPAVLGADHTYSRTPQRTANMRLRAEQVSRPISANTGKWRTGLTPADAARIRTRTAELYAKLGGTMPE